VHALRVEREPKADRLPSVSRSPLRHFPFTSIPRGLCARCRCLSRGFASFLRLRLCSRRWDLLFSKDARRSPVFFRFHIRTRKKDRRALFCRSACLTSWRSCPPGRSTGGVGSQTSREFPFAFLYHPASDCFGERFLSGPGYVQCFAFEVFNVPPYGRARSGMKERRSAAQRREQGAERYPFVGMTPVP